MTRKRGIPTHYRGLTFRSRIEARWAVMFDKLGWPWEYEPLDLDGYIPDFVLQLHRPLLVEVRHEMTTIELERHTDKIERSGWQHEAIILGATPLLPSGGSWNLAGAGFGLMGEKPYRESDDDPELVRWWADAVLFRCRECGRNSLLHSDASWTCRTSGCASHGGDHHVGEIDFDLEAAWRSAHNPTAWRAAA